MDASLTFDPTGTTLLVSLVLPYIIAVVKQPGLPKWGVGLLTIVLSFAGGVLSAVLTGQLSGHDLYQNTVMVLMASSIFYTSIGKTAGLTELEAVTNRLPTADSADDS